MFNRLASPAQSSGLPRRSLRSLRQASAVLVAALAVLLVGCSGIPTPDLPDFRLPRPGIPSVFKVGIQQGNVITQRMVDQLEPGMSYAQVEYVLGEPVLRNTFREDRWDYHFSISIGDEVVQQNRLTVYFEAGRLAYFEGDLVPGADAEPDDADADQEDADAESDAESDPAPTPPSEDA